MRRAALLLVLLALPCMAFDKGKCENGHGGAVKCTACGCLGNPDKPKASPSEPGGNPTYPSYKCKQACSPQCCGCPLPEASYDGTGGQRPRTMFFAGKHDASAHVTKAGGKPHCSACKKGK